MTLVRPNNPPSPGRGPKRSRSVRPRKKKGCPLFLLAWVIIGALVVYAAWAFVVGAGQLVAFALGAVIGP